MTNQNNIIDDKSPLTFDIDDLPNTTGDRLQLVLKKQNIQQHELAEMLGTKQSTISKICGNITKNSKYLPDIANVLNIDINWLIHGKSKNSENNWQSGLHQQKNKFILIGMHGDKDSTSEESPDMNPNKENKLMFDNDLIPEGKTADDIEFFIVKDTAMDKVANVNARVTYDKTDTSVISGKLYAIQFGELAQLRYLFLMPNKRVRIGAEDKENYPDEVVDLDQDDFKILGKIITITNIVN